MLSHAGHRGHGNRRKCSIRLRQRQQFIDAAYALGGDNTELGKVAAQGVDSHRALLDQQFTGLVQHQNGLLVVTLDRYEAHIRSRHRLADRRRVDHVILASLDVGLDVGRWYQNHLVPHRGQLASPIMRRTAGLHATRQGSICENTSCSFERFTFREIDRPPSLSSA